jgi:hypothetical protein
MEERGADRQLRPERGGQITVEVAGRSGLLGADLGVSTESSKRWETTLLIPMEP